MAPILTRLGVGRGGFGFGRRATSPIYTILPSVSSLNEGSPVTFTVNTINVQSGTTLYWTINSVSGTVNASDFNEGVSGSFVIAGNTGSVVLNVSNDATTEGSESFQFQVRTGSTSGTVVATSATITIGDTSLNPTYSVSPSTSSVNEGSSVTFTTTTTNVPNSTTLYWTLSTISGTINSSDFSGGATSGSFTITSNSGSVVLTLANDVTTEGSESFQFQVRTGSTSGTVVATSTTVTINDTSQAPPVLSTTGSINASAGTINDAFDGNLATYVARSQQISVNNHTGSMIFTWSVAVPVSSTIRLAVAMGSSSNQTTSVTITDSLGNVHNTSVTNQWAGGSINLQNLNSTYPYSNIKQIQFFNTYNPASVSAVEVDGTILVY